MATRVAAATVVAGGVLYVLWRWRRQATKAVRVASDERVPVTVLTGFLGSWKTTLFNRILTASHGMCVAYDPVQSPPLATLHTGPWVVLPVDMHRCADDAMMPFRWIAAQRR